MHMYVRTCVCVCICTHVRVCVYMHVCVRVGGKQLCAKAGAGTLEKQWGNREGGQGAQAGLTRQAFMTSCHCTL